MLPPEHPKFIAAQAGTWHMSESQAQALRRHAMNADATPGLAERCAFRKGQVIYRQGEKGSVFYFVLQGRVQLSSVYPDGSVFVFDVMGENGLFGDDAVLAQRPYIASATVIDGCELLRFDVNILLAALPGCPELATVFVQIMADRQFRLALRLRHMSHLDPDICVGGLLLSLVMRPAASVAGPAPPRTVNLTQEQMASMTGLSRITVSRSLKRLQAGGYIVCVRRQIVVQDPARLLHLISSEPAAIALPLASD